MQSIRSRKVRTRPAHHATRRRRAAVAAQVAIGMTAMVGFVALSVDVGYMYNAKGELQRAADASALAAAAELGDWTGGSPKDAAEAIAQEFANRNFVLGEGVGLELVNEAKRDITFGRAHIDESTDRYVFTPDPNEPFPNAVRVRLRRTSDAPSHAVPLFFARIFGADTTDIAAHATAVLTPRDIAFVLDLSTSHNDDSSLRSFKNTEIANKDVFDELADTESAFDPQTDSLGFESQVSLLDNGDGTTTVMVSLTSVSAAKALSHVTFGLPAEAQGSVMGSAWTDGDYESPEWGTDPTTGVSGIKFNAVGDGLGEDGAVETHNFSFAVANEQLSAIQLGVATKAGTGVDTDVAYNLQPEVTIGNLREWGDEVTGPSWDFANDDGLVQLPQDSDWNLNSDWVSQTISERGYAAYTPDEMEVINNRALRDGYNYEWSSDYRRRVKVALGIDMWVGDENENGLIDSDEVLEMIDYPSDSTNPDTLSKEVGGSWDQFIDYVRSSNSNMSKYEPWNQIYGDPGMRHRYGLKTFTDYLQEKEYGDNNSPGLAGSPQQPMGAVADSVMASLDIIEELQGGDFVGLAGYATHGYGPGEKPDDMSWLIPGTDLDPIRDRISELQPGMWTTNTNVAQGIDRGVDVLLNSENARPYAAKVLLLLTDGIANQVRPEPTYWNTYEARQDAIQAADDARNQGVTIYTISVGANADQGLMKRIADPNYNEDDPPDPDVVARHFHAEGSVDDYKVELETIFKKLGGERPVVLIE